MYRGSGKIYLQSIRVVAIYIYVHKIVLNAEIRYCRDAQLKLQAQKLEKYFLGIPKRLAVSACYVISV